MIYRLSSYSSSGCWQNEAIASLLSQSLPSSYPITQAEVSISIGGECTGRIDAIVRVILNVLVKAGIIADVGISFMSQLSISYHPQKQQGMAIAIAEATIKLPNNSPDADLLGNSPTARELRQQRGYIGHIRPKRIKGHIYYYWIYYEWGERVEKYMGKDFDRAIAKAKAIGDPRKEVGR
jgi:hypothetical protein